MRNTDCVTDGTYNIDAKTTTTEPHHATKSTPLDPSLQVLPTSALKELKFFAHGYKGEKRQGLTNASIYGSPIELACYNLPSRKNTPNGNRLNPGGMQLPLSPPQVHHHPRPLPFRLFRHILGRGTAAILVVSLPNSSALGIL